MEERNIDLYPTFMPFEKQATKADGTKINPAATPTVRIFEEGGADATFDNSEIAGSPFTCAIINAKVGNYGVLVAKSLFTAGKIYRVLFEWTIDGIATAFEESFLATDSSDFKATVTNLDVAVSSRATNAGVWTAADRALSVPGDYKADVSAVALEANVRGHADDALAGYDPPTRTEATSDKDEVIAKVNTTEGKVDAVKADTAATLADTNEMQGKLPALAIAGEAEATVNAAAIITEVNENEVKTDAVKVDTAAIKAKTDTMSTDPATKTKQEEIITKVEAIDLDRNFNTSGD